MFGGLELKGASPTKSTPTSTTEADATTAAAAATAPPSSAFSFLNSFMSTDSTTSIPSPAAESSAADATAVSHGTSSSTSTSHSTSAFGFLSSSSAPPDVSDAGTTAAVAAVATPTTAFDFLSDASAPVPPLPSALTAVTSSSGTTTSMNTSSDSILDLDWGAAATPSSGRATASASTATVSAVGSGVMFGGAEVKKAVKKRTRTAKIGAAAQATPPPPVDRKQSGMVIYGTMGASTGATTGTSTVRDDALEATRRAEEFLHAKVASEALAAHSHDLTIRSVPSEEDDIIIAAKAAAKEAHKLEAKKGTFGRSNSGTSAGGGGGGTTSTFGGLFRSRAKSPPTQQSASRLGTLSSSSLASASSSDIDGPATGMRATAAMAIPSGAERLQREQEDVKRAMAERQWKMMQQQQHIHPNTISEDSAEDAVSSYQPVAVATATPALVSVKAVAPTPKPVDVLSSVPKPVTARDKLDQMLEDFRRQVVRAMNEMTRLRQQRTGLLEERFVTNAKERLAGQQKARALEQQAAAAETEDFELADTMSSLIDRHGQEQAEYAAILHNIGRAIATCDQQKRSCADDVTRYFHDIQEKLSAVQREQETADSKKATASLDTFSAISKQLSAEHERLQNDWKHLERDGELVADERRELEKAISEQSGAFETLRDQARAKLVSVDEEIEELRTLLQAKQRVAAELRTEAAGHEESVLKVRVKFARQLTRLQKKEMTIQDNTEEWESEKRSFELQKQQHELVVQEHSEAMIARDQLLADIGHEIDLAHTLASIVAKEVGFDVNAGRDEPECDDELAQRQANVVKCEAAVAESKAALKSVVTVLQSLSHEVQTLTQQIPQLEELKKTAAERRDFKAAGKASKDIKEATSRLAECTVELESETAGRKEAAEQEVSRLQIELEQARTVAEAMERESATATMERLADNIQRLVTTKQGVCDGAADRSVTSVGAFVLEAQIKVLTQEGQAYGDKYGGWTELMSGIDLKPNESSNDTTELEVADSVPLTEEPATADTTSTDAVSTPPNVDSSEDVHSKMVQFRQVTQRLSECEQQLEAAVAEDDFDTAAALDEVLQELLAQVQGLNMTDDEMARALALPLESDANSDTATIEPSIENSEPPVEVNEPVSETVDSNENETTPVESTPDSNENETSPVESTPDMEEDTAKGESDMNVEQPTTEADEPKPDEIDADVDDAPEAADTSDTPPEPSVDDESKEEPSTAEEVI